MMLLRSSPASPFGRKVKIAADVLGLSGEIEMVQTDTGNPDDPLRKDNPLGKIPTLVTEEGVAIYDSRVIVEYLDQRAGGGRIIPADPKQRIAVLRAADPGNHAPIPVDLVTASGSGLDPEISPAAAQYQLARVARARGLPVSEVQALVARCTRGRQFGVLGEPRVNVLQLNLALDELPAHRVGANVGA